jgi:Domain of unknown function (DUF4192)
MSGINLSTPHDIIAAVPYLLGFHPQDSLVVIAVTARRVEVILRYDLPDTAATGERDLAGAVADQLAGVLAQHKTDSVVLLGYGIADRARPVLVAAIARLADVLTIREVLLISGARFWSLLCADCCPPEGIEIDSPATIPAAQFTALGFAPFPSRDAIAATIGPVEDTAAEAMRAAVERAAGQLPPVGAGGPDARHLARLRELLASSAPLSDADAADLIVLLGHIRLRDEAWVMAAAGDADDQVAFWTDLTRRAPSNHVAPPASVLAYIAACMTGDTVLARTAVDRALAVDPDYYLAQLIEMMLNSGARPTQCRIQATAADLEAVPDAPAS